MEFEFAILDFIRKNLTNPFLDGFMKAITQFGDSGIFWIILGIILIIPKKTRKIGFSVCLALLFSLIFCNLALKPLIARERPFQIIESIELIIPPPSEYSFPSGHSSVSFAGAIAIFMHKKRLGIPAIIIASLIAFSRLYLYVHFPTDVLGGAMLGVICGIASSKIIEYIYLKKKPA